MHSPLLTVLVGILHPSLLLVLLQMVTGSRAWAGMSHMAVVNAVCCQKLQLQFPADAPEGLVILGQACMSYDPNDRPSFRDVLEILEPLNELLVGKGDLNGGDCMQDQQQKPELVDSF